jgi:hypothetical protein
LAPNTAPISAGVFPSMSRTRFVTRESRHDTTKDGSMKNSTNASVSTARMTAKT